MKVKIPHEKGRNDLLGGVLIPFQFKWCIWTDSYTFSHKIDNSQTDCFAIHQTHLIYSKKRK